MAIKIPIEKHLFYEGGQKPRRPRGNSKPRHGGICDAFQLSIPPLRRWRPCRSENEASISFQGSCKCFAGVFYFRSGAYRICSGRPVGAEPFQILLHFMGSAQKSFQTQIWNPQSPIISLHFRFRIFSNVNGERERMFCAVRVAGRGQRMGNIGKSFVKVLTFLGKYVFWGIIEIKQRNYNDKCISQFFALLLRAFSGVWSFKKSLCRISIFYFFYMRRFCPNVFGLLFYSYLGK